jgi:cell division GTPase FtsZ
MVMEAKRVCLFNEVSSLCGAGIKAEVDEIIWKMTHESQLVPMIMKDLEYLYEESFIAKRRFYSASEYRRMDSIVNEVIKYQSWDKKSFTHVLILLQTSKEHPLIISELQRLNEITDGFSSKAEIRWGLGINEDLGDRVFIMIVYSK